MTRRLTANEPNAEVIEAMLRSILELSGAMVALCTDLKSKSAEEMAAAYTRQAVRAAKLLGLYEEEGS